MDWKDTLASSNESGAEWLMFEILAYNYAHLITNENFVLQIPIKVLKQKTEQAKQIEMKYADEKVREAMVMIIRSMSELNSSSRKECDGDD